MPKRNGLRICPCCSQVVSRAVYDDHADILRQQLEAKIAGLALLDSPAAHAIPPEREPDVHCVSPPSLQNTVTSAQSSDLKVPTTTPTENEAPNISTTQVDDAGLAMYRELYKIDARGNELFQSSDAMLDACLSPPELSQVPQTPSRQSIAQAERHAQASSQWMQDQRARVQTLCPVLDAPNKIYASTLIDHLQERVDKLAFKVNSLKRPVVVEDLHDSPTSASPPAAFDTERYFSNPILTLPPATLVVLMTAVILNLLAHVTRGPCNFVLEMSKYAIRLAAGFNEDSYSEIPTDIRTARQHFQLDPVLTVFAVCKCNKLHPPTQTTPFPIYPPTCQCGAGLTKVTGFHKGVAIRKPRKTYVMQSFSDHCARVYCQPGYEVLIRRQHQLAMKAPRDGISDITQAQAYRTLPGPDGRPFIDCSTEIRTVWALSYDGYNPMSNKIAGKAASVGSLAMACLSLPPAIRNRPENLYLAGLIPGPRQPSADGLNPYLSPLIDHLHTSYHTGTWWSRTHEHPNGIRSREAILPLVTDLPAARKMVGGAGHSASIFCMYCSVLLADINNIDMTTPGWTPKTSSQFRRAAEEWRNAPTRAKRKDLYRRNGVRWSELLRLEYWDPLQYTVIDGMHNLFLGLVQHHFREAIGTHWDVKLADHDEHEEPPSQKDLGRGRGLLDRGEATLASLERLSLPALRQLCSERQARPVALPGKRKLHKRQYAVALLGPSPETRPPRTSRFFSLEETDADLFAMELGEGSPQTTRQPLLYTEDLQAIQHDIRNTLRPWNQPSPPNNFGSPSHGKLKADQWRACIEFDLPVSLAKIWGDDMLDPADGDPQLKALALESTFLLAIAIRYATSHRTTPHHREKYLEYMHKYLKSLLLLDPSNPLHPNHHNALHLPRFMELFGPIRGWWMFPFERLIGILQKQKTNFKFGELEETVMNTFCAAAHLRNLLERQEETVSPSSSDTFPSILRIVRKRLPDVAKGSMLQSPVHGDEVDDGKPTSSLLDPDITSSFLSADLRGVYVNVYSRIHRNDCVFSPMSSSRAYSTIFFSHSPQSQDLRPATIRQIFKFDSTVYLVVHCFKRKHPSLFDRFSDFGAQVWSQEQEEHPQIIPLSSDVYPSHLREWDGGKMVLKPVVPSF